MQPSNEAQMTPQQHAEHIAYMLREAQQECRMDIGRVNDPRAQALFETVAEVLGGTMKALDDYCTRSEPAWRSSQSYMRPSSPSRSDMAVDVNAANPPPRMHDVLPGDNA